MIRKRILLTGSTGFIGQHVLVELLKSYEVHAVILPGEKTDTQPNLTYYHLDLLDADRATLGKLIQDIQPQICLHLAWYTKHENYLSADVNEQWLEVSKGLADSFYQNGGQRFVATGTCIEYDLSQATPCREDTTPLKPEYLYALCKMRLFEYLNEYYDNFAWARVFFVYGPGDRANRLIPYIIETLDKDKVATAKYGSDCRDYILVGDLASQLVEIVGSTVAGSINTGTGKAVSIGEIFRQVADIMGKPDNVVINDIQGQSHNLIQPDMGKFKDQVGEIQARSLREGLKETIDWFNE